MKRLKTADLSNQICEHRVIHSIPYYPFNVQGIRNDDCLYFLLLKIVVK